ncbi:hypothetical protein FNJ88_12905 [Chryseobacterium sp. SNU WT5]|uniref:hypothetical protein n=1 Tax=Chryseobacterium sp. SNU WT5 TaxID=2594269 RepID=UPI00117F5994|nr:hypothetical protein [Chryseobacterium sp. SNU WT5]QDP86407.1 hypothetical protein FNJ88_12905 [Chryseobacterium sp. SNU WT5]
MNYKITATFTELKNATVASELLKIAGYIKEFSGFTANTKIYPESLVEDHFLDENVIMVYTPNLNRAYKALNILKRLEASITEGLGSKLKDSKIKITAKHLTFNNKPYINFRNRISTKKQ